MIFRTSMLVYRWLLYLYPADFRREYGDLMLCVFEDTCHDRTGWVALWGNTVRDLIQSVYHEYRNKAMKIDNYEVNAILGEGTTASLYRVYDSQQAEQVVLKVFSPELDASLERHIVQEQAVHLQLDHPNIPRCFAYIPDGRYLVMEYINGKTLLDILQERNTPFPVHQVIGWAVTICEVLVYLHGQGYIYRDMKPGNLMLTADDRLYLIDYGITVPAEGDGIAIGTIGYAPPEQYKGVATPQSDVYALGATLHHLLTNRDPRYHDAHTFHDAPPRNFNRDVSLALEAVILQALAHDPAERYADADALREALLGVE